MNELIYILEAIGIVIVIAWLVVLVMELIEVMRHG